MNAKKMLRLCCPDCKDRKPGLIAAVLTDEARMLLVAKCPGCGATITLDIEQIIVKLCAKDVPDGN